MTDIKLNKLNIEPLVSEIENVLRKGINSILKTYIDRSETLEKAYQTILTVISELNTPDKLNFTEPATFQSSPVNNIRDEKCL